MAIDFRRHLGTTGANNAATVTVLPVTKAVAAGETILVAFVSVCPWGSGWDSSGSITCADDATNTYVQVYDGQPTYPDPITNYYNASPPRIVVFAAYGADPLSISDAITITHPTGPAELSLPGGLRNTSRVLQALAVSGLTHHDEHKRRNLHRYEVHTGDLRQEDQDKGNEFLLVVTGWSDPNRQTERTNLPAPGSWHVFDKQRSPSASAPAWNANYVAASRIFWKEVSSKGDYGFRSEFNRNGYKPYYGAAILSFKSVSAGDGGGTDDDEPDQENFSTDYGAGAEISTSEITLADWVVADSGGMSGEVLEPGADYPRDFIVTERVKVHDYATVNFPGIQEKLRIAPEVPEDGVNLAWVRIPELSPESNISLVDTASFIAENVNQVIREKVYGGEPTDNGYLYKIHYNAPPANARYEFEWSPSYQIHLRALTQSELALSNFTQEIKVLPPDADSWGPWYLRVQDGVVTRRYVMQAGDESWLTNCFSVGDTLMLYYTVVETAQIPYHNLGVSGSNYRDAQVVDVSGRVLTLLDERTLQFPDQDLVEILSLQINGEEQITLPSGTIRITDLRTQDWQQPPRQQISSWDPEAGQITLSRTIGLDSQVIASYRYHEYYYTFRGYTEEGSGTAYSGRFRDLNLNPAPGYTFDGGRSTADLLNRAVFVYLLPSAAYRITKADGTEEGARTIFSGQKWTENFLRWDLIGPTESFDPADDPFDPCRSRSTFGYTHFGSAVFIDDLPADTTVTPATSGSSGLVTLPSALLLAKVYVTPNSQVENVEVVDTRVRGGGIPIGVDLTDPSLPGATRQLAEAYWDQGSWDGPPVPLMGVLLVELPQSLLTGANGYPRFTQEEIEQICQRHCAAGVRLLIRYRD